MATYHYTGSDKAWPLARLQIEAEQFKALESDGKLAGGEDYVKTSEGILTFSGQTSYWKCFDAQGLPFVLADAEFTKRYTLGPLP